MKPYELCNEWEDLLALRLEDLSTVERASLEAHLAACSACAAISDYYRRMQASLAALPTPTMEPIPYAWKRENEHEGREELQQESVEDILMRYDEYIRTLVKQRVSKICLPAKGEEATVVDDIVQETFIKFYQALKRTQIKNHHAYIRDIVQTVCIDWVRKQRKPVFTLDPSVDVAEISLLSPVDAEQQEMQHLLDTITELILTLPPRQRHAMLCFLKEHIDNTPLLEETLLRYNINIRNIYWPKEIQEKQRLLASLTVAKKKLRQLLSQQPERKGQLEQIEPHSIRQIEALLGIA